MENKEKFMDIRFPGRKGKYPLRLNSKNNMWLEKRKNLSWEERIQPYKLLGLEKWLVKETPKKLDYLDLHFLDPLTGILGEEYISALPRKKWEKMVMLYLSNECIEKINRNLSWKMGDIVMYVAGTILKEIKEVVVRLHNNGLYFLVLNAQYDTIIEAKMKLARTSIFFSNGYQIKGIGLRLEYTKAFPYTYPLIRMWGETTETEILKTAQITEDIKWVNVFVCSEFYERIEGEILTTIINGRRVTL